MNHTTQCKACGDKGCSECWPNEESSRPLSKSEFCSRPLAEPFASAEDYACGLKSLCPFCGSPGKIQDISEHRFIRFLLRLPKLYQVWCTNKSCPVMLAVGTFYSIEEAVKAWETRPEPNTPVILDVLDETVKALKEYADHAADCMEGTTASELAIYEDQMKWAIEALQKLGFKYDPITGEMK